MNDRRLRGLFALTAAAAAATVTDPVVETASNAGCFGPGSFTDHSTADVVPVLAVASLAALTYVYLRARPATSVATEASATCSSARAVAQPCLPLLPWIFASQLAVLFAMETCEQIAVTGHPLGGTVWLGAPVAIALTVHAVACVLSAFALARILPGLTRAAVALALLVRRSRGRLAVEARGTRVSASDAPATPPADPMAARLGKRAPPLLAA